MRRALRGGGAMLLDDGTDGAEGQRALGRTSVRFGTKARLRGIPRRAGASGRERGGAMRRQAGITRRPVALGP